MEFYSNKIFYFLITVYILAVILVLLYWFVSVQLACWAISPHERCEQTKINEGLFNGLLPFLFVAFSALIIILQQKGYKRIGYFIIPLMLLSPFFRNYIINYPTWFNVEWFSSIANQSGVPISEIIFFLFGMLILILISIIPFYVLAKLIKEDFFKNRRGVINKK